MVFLLYIDGVNRLGSDYTIIARDRKTPRYTKNIIAWSQRIKRFKKSDDVKLIAMSFHTWRSIDSDDLYNLSTAQRYQASYTLSI